jgi:lipoate-protein ligase A
VAWEELAGALMLGFAQAGGIEFRPDVLSNEEEELARRLERERYTDGDWTFAAAGAPACRQAGR